MTKRNSKWGVWDDETDPCPQCMDGDAVPVREEYHCDTCDADWYLEDDEEPA